MSRDPVERIAQTVLYEGYVLWPYRRSALKNRQRWTFGGVFPERWSRAHPDDPSVIETECLLEAPGEPRLDVRVRFLQVVERRVAEGTPPDLRYVDSLEAAGERHVAWEEATEREVRAPGAIAIPAGRRHEPLPGRAGVVERAWRPLRGRVELRLEALGDGVHRVAVRIVNATPWAGEDRAEALRHAFVSTHTVLRAREGAFVSLMDPPERLRAAADACRNQGTWPVLVGEEGERHTMLSSPIILYDHPQIAPESPGDLFDATEIDQLLVLNVLSMTEDEQREVRASDPRARELLDRCAGLSREQLMGLHGAVRELRPVDEP
jgi:hypothetical protein